jgi:hypothetical protein
VNAVAVSLPAVADDQKSCAIRRPSRYLQMMSRLPSDGQQFFLCSEPDNPEDAPPQTRGSTMQNLTLLIIIIGSIIIGLAIGVWMRSKRK